MTTPLAPAPRISLIVAVARNGVIGRDGKLPWKLRSDLQRFKRLTWGRPLIMGRATFESLGRVLPGRPHVVLSRQSAYRPAGVTVVASWSDALRAAAPTTARDWSGAVADGPVPDQEEVFVIGGAAVFAEALPSASRVYVTEVDAAPDGNTFFPGAEFVGWTDVVAPQPVAASDVDEYAMTFRTLERGIVVKGAEHTRIRTDPH